MSKETAEAFSKGRLQGKKLGRDFMKEEVLAMIDSMIATLASIDWNTDDIVRANTLDEVKRRLKKL